MNDVGAPPSTYGKNLGGTDPYGYGTGQAGGAQDPWAAYGMPAGGPGGGEAVQTPEMQAYVQQLYYYHQMYNQMLYSATDPNQISQLRQYDAQVLQYLQQVGAPPPQEGMPMGGDPNALGPQQEPSQYVNTPPDYQTKEYVVFENGASSNATIDRKDPDKREANYYQPSNVCNIPSNAASVKVTMQPDDANPADRMAVVEITFKNPDGTEEKRIVKYHGADREGFQLAVNTPSTEQVDLTGVPEDLQEKIKWGQSAAPEQLKGDPPTKMDGDTRIYDGQNFDISPVPSGKDEHTEVMASGDVTYAPNSNTEYTVVSQDADGNYVIKVYKDETKTDPPKETITIDGGLINNINFACDPSRIEFEAPLGKGEGNHQIDENNVNGAKLHMTGAEGEPGIHSGSPMNPEGLADTPVTSVEGTVPGDGTVYYNDPQNSAVELLNYPPPTGAKNVDITTPDTVTLHAKTYDYKAEVTKNSDGTYTIVMYKGDSPADDPNKVTYVVHGPPSKITLDLLPGNVKYNGAAYTGGVDPVISVTGETQGTNSPQAIIDGLLTATGRTEAQLLSGLDGAGYSYTSVEEFRSAIASGAFPPNPADAKLLNFFRTLDPTLGDLLSDQYIESSQQASTESGANDRIVALLAVVYPNSIINKGDSSGDNLGFSIDGTYHTWAWSWQDGHNEISLD